MLKYEATYSDERGTIKTRLFSDGSKFYLKLRGIDFIGHCFDSIEAEDKKDDLRNKFDLNREGELINFNLLIDFSIKIRSKALLKDYILSISIVNRDEALSFTAHSLIGDDIDLPLNFTHQDTFEYIPIMLQKKLPSSMKLEVCAACRYSHYWVGGNVAYGDLSCFKSHKIEAEKIHDKSSFMDYPYFKEAIGVQETFSCEEFATIRKNDWNYKDWDWNILQNKS